MEQLDVSRSMAMERCYKDIGRCPLCLVKRMLHTGYRIALKLEIRDSIFKNKSGEV
jgi:hypothetical protein